MIVVPVGRRCDLNVNFGTDTHSFCGDITVGCDPFLDNQVAGGAGGSGGAGAEGGAGGAGAEGGAGGAGAEGGAGGAGAEGGAGGAGAEGGAGGAGGEGGAGGAGGAGGLQMSSEPQQREPLRCCWKLVTSTERPANVWRRVRKRRGRRVKDRTTVLRGSNASSYVRPSAVSMVATHRLALTAHQA